jgi:hypothetical protein
VEEYLLKVLYPEGLTRNVSLTLGVLVILLNLVAYVIALRRRLARVASRA